MLTDYQMPQHFALNWLARGLFTSLFFLSGVTHFTDLGYYLSLMHEGIPYRVLLIYLSGIVELLGAGMILFNWRPRLGGWLLVLFLVPVTVVAHGYEMIHAEDEVMRLMQQAHFLKGIALTGAALLITQLGVSAKR